MSATFPARRPHGVIRCVLGINANSQSWFRLQLAQPRHGSRRSTDCETVSGSNSHSVRRTATISRRKLSQPGLAVDATVAVQLETPSNGMRYGVGAMQSRQ